MRRWLAVVVLAASACGGADDGEVFGADAGATSYGPSGLPNCETTCDAKHKAYCSAPGHKAEELGGAYKVVETASNDGKTTWVLDTKAEDERVTAYCWTMGDSVVFTSH